MKMFLNSFYSLCATIDTSHSVCSSLDTITQFTCVPPHFVSLYFIIQSRFVPRHYRQQCLSLLWFSFPASGHATTRSASLYHSPKFLACFLQPVAAEIVPVIMAFDKEYPSFPEDGQSHPCQLVADYLCVFNSLQG